MINEIIEAISISLNAEFSEKEYEIYMEEIKQDLKEPCFFIACIKPKSELFFGKRYSKENPFCIQYFPETGEIQRECNAAAERMVKCLEYITAEGDLIRGTNMNYEIVDGVLHFFVNYDFFTYRREDVETMETLESETNVRR